MSNKRNADEFERKKTTDFSKNSREVRQKWFWLSSNCSVILVWKLTLNMGKSWTKYWRFVLEMIFLSKFISILRESRNDHNSRTSSKRNTNDLLQPQGLSATIQIQVDSEDKQIKQNAMQIYIDMPNTANVLLSISELESF